MEERKRGMMRGAMLGDTDEKPITMMDTSEQTSAKDVNENERRTERTRDGVGNKTRRGG